MSIRALSYVLSLNEVTGEKIISGTELLVLVILADTAWDNGDHAFLSEKRIAARAGISRQTVNATIDKLLARGLIIYGSETVRDALIKHGGHRPKTYQINMEYHLSLGVKNPDTRGGPGVKILALRCQNFQDQVSKIPTQPIKENPLKTQRGESLAVNRCPAHQNFDFPPPCHNCKTIRESAAAAQQADELAAKEKSKRKLATAAKRMGIDETTMSYIRKAHQRGLHNNPNDSDRRYCDICQTENELEEVA